MLRKDILIFTIVLILVSCNSSKSENNVIDFSFDDKNIKVFNAKSIEIPNVCDSLISTNYVLSSNDKLIINEIGPDGLFHVVDLKNEKYLGLYGSKGLGPGELGMPVALYKENDLLQIFDIQQKKIVTFQLDSLPQKKNFQSEIILGKLNGATEAVIVGNETYSLSHTKAGNRIYISDLEGNEKKGIGTIPFQNHDKFPENTFAEGHPAKLQYSNNVFALAYLTTPVIQIFNKSTNKWSVVKGPENFSSIFRTNETDNNLALGYTHDTRLGYTCIRVSPNYIYALYSGENLFKTSDYNFKNVYVFDLNGEPIKKIVLDKGVISFDVLNDKTLYGVNAGLKNTTLKFQIQ